MNVYPFMNWGIIAILFSVLSTASIILLLYLYNRFFRKKLYDHRGMKIKNGSTGFIGDNNHVTINHTSHIIGLKKSNFIIALVIILGLNFIFFYFLPSFKFKEGTQARRNEKLKFYEKEITQLIRVCAPSKSLSLKLEGQVGVILDEMLENASGSLELYEDAKILELMINATPNDSVMIYQMYIDCVYPQLENIISNKK